MKPEQFIREYGVIRAKELINDPLHPKMTHVSDDGRHWVNEHNKNLDENIRKQLPSLIRLEDLKRLVESLDLVESWGGIDDVKLYDLSHCKNRPESAGYKLLQAIKDHESIYGEE
ncbi:hypothetical protein QZK38_05150 [Acinetobacter baumannii]|nr:hypothetical protein [Acinetobacter baumannii]